MNDVEELHQGSEERLSEILVGRRIVASEKGPMTVPGREDWYHDTAEGMLTLDDGTKLYLTGNKGGCSCSAGDYELTDLATVDNVITSARIESNPDDDWDNEGAGGVYKIFVIADATEINVATFEGSDGNGYYGSGFQLYVIPAGA